MYEVKPWLWQCYSGKQHQGLGRLSVPATVGEERHKQLFSDHWTAVGQ